VILREVRMSVIELLDNGVWRYQKCLIWRAVSAIRN
jgi:hypothetical protein